MYEDAAKAGVTVIGLHNVLSDAEMEEKLKKPALQKYSTHNFPGFLKIEHADF